MKYKKKEHQRVGKTWLQATDGVLHKGVNLLH